jgi:hypothetical protein
VALAKGEDKENILSGFRTRSEKLKNGEWKEGWHEFCLTRKEQYRDSIARAMLPESTETENNFFAHYLDCEAHTDVWRELFPTWNKTNCIEKI